MLKKLTNKKGFTLMEMLIVVAIIAILIAIAIPTFSGALTKAHTATDTANIRAGYASAQIEVMTSNTVPTDTYLQPDGSIGAKNSAYKCSGEQKTTVQIGGKLNASWEKGQVIKYTVDANGVTGISAETAS